ncbi:uracil-DNA glycosylase [bacterium]|nr:uracil-DNA glycosylase [bacterium]
MSWRSQAQIYLRDLALFEEEIYVPTVHSQSALNVEVSKPDVHFEGAISPLPANLAIFEKEICTCTKCSLGSTRTKFVFGDGNPHARIVFVGEAPGFDEDQTGIPFVGKAGQLLNEMLSEVGLKREDVYICNTLKCRPPQNRDPLPEEKQVCKPYLLTQLALINPEIIVCLGRHAASELLGSESAMKDVRGRVISWREKKLLVTYHPAYYLRNMSQRTVGEADFKLLRQLYDQLSN